MAHFPIPFFKKARQLWYVEIDRKQHCLGPDKEAAFVQYHQLMQVRQRTPLGLAAAGFAARSWRSWRTPTWSG